MGLKNTYQARKRFTKTPVSNTGMWYQNNPVVVPSNRITMKGPNGESDYFDSPIMGIGMQSGQKQIMQPGREYSFPNDNSVYERKMQNGAEVALDVTSMIPGPVGMTASGLGLAYDLYQGDWLGAGLNTANILTGGAAKGFMAAARVANNAGTRNLARGLASSSHNLNRASKIGNSFTQPVDRARTILNSNPYQQTQFGGYQDNTRLAPMIKPRMQGGGLYAVGPYDEMMAPKQGNYLLPDINRPSYLDEFGGMRSEYKMGFNDSGKEVLIPTVVQGKQLSEDEAIDNYYRTGLHMGKYDTVQDAENASALRTAKYNMLQDPVRFDMTQYQKGGLTPIYVSNPDDPRLKAYNDSTDAYDYGVRSIKEYNAAIKKGKEKGTPLKKIPRHNQSLTPWIGTNIMPIESKSASPTGTSYGWENSDPTLWTSYTKFKKPVQPVQYKPAQKQVSYPNQPIGTGMKRSISKNINPIQKSTPTPIYVNDPIEKPVATVQPKTTPTVTVKDINEDKANTLKNQYQESTGTPFKSKDQIFNSLQQSLKRKPTVKEYNDAVEQFNRANRSMQYGGWLKSYQNAGEVSTEQNPEPIGQVHVRAKDKGWFDNYIQRPLRKFGRSYAQRISDATGGSEWYKQPNPFMNLAFESMNAPQYAATYAVTGKVQTPSEAMNIQNPYGAFAVNMVLDPLGGPAIAKGLAKGLPAAARYATTRTPLKNAYKINPWAFKPNEANWYRQVGKSAIDDALNSRLIREAGEEVSPRMYQEFQDQLVRMQGSGSEAMLATRRPISPFFAKGELFYPMGRKPIITKSGKISKNPAGKGDADYLIETNLPNESFQPAYVKGMSLGVPTEVGQTAILKPNPSLRTIDNFNFYKKDWLKGYKQINTPKQPIKNIYERNPASISNLGEADSTITDLLDIFGIPDRVANIKNIGSELKGEIIKGGKNRKAIEEGNTWLKNWIDDPITQNKIENDLAWASQRNDQYGLGYQQAKSFTPISKEYPFSQQLKDLFSGDTHMHSGNTGVSYLHRKDPYERLMPETLNNPKMGSFISRIPSRSSAQRRSTTIHEGTHDWTSNYLLRESGQTDFIKDLYSDNLKKSMSSGTYDYSPEAFHLEYLAKPTEMHARIMQLRNLLGMTPEQSTMVTPEMAKDIIRKIEIPENAKFVDPKFLNVIDKDPKKLAALFNRLWAAPAATALGASQLEKKKYGGLQRSYLKTKKFK